MTNLKRFYPIKILRMAVQICAILHSLPSITNEIIFFTFSIMRNYNHWAVIKTPFFINKHVPGDSCTEWAVSRRRRHSPVVASWTRARLRYQLGLTPALLCQICSLKMWPRLSGNLATEDKCPERSVLLSPSERRGLKEPGSTARPPQPSLVPKHK